MRRVLFVTPHFPPDSSAGTHRVRLLAPHMAAHGWEPTVLTVDARDYEGRLDTALATSVPADLRVIRARMAGVCDAAARHWRSWPACLPRAEMRLRNCSRASRLTRCSSPSIRPIRRVARAVVEARLRRRVRARLSGSMGRRMGPLRWTCLRRPAGFQEPRQPLDCRASRAHCARQPADGVTAVSHATHEQALARMPEARTRQRSCRLMGSDGSAISRRPGIGSADDGCLHVSLRRDVVADGVETLRALFAAIAAERQRDRQTARMRFHFFGTSNLRSADALPVCSPSPPITAWPTSSNTLRVSTTSTRVAVLRASNAVLLLGSRERHYTPSKVFPALSWSGRCWR